MLKAKKDITVRIAFYTKKVAEFGAIHPSKKRNAYRHQRLLQYKKLMHQVINEQNWRVISGN